MDKTFESIEHMADLALRIYGRDAAGLIANAARGLMALITEPSGIRPAVPREVSVQAPNLADLVVVFLNELLFLFDTEQFLWVELEFRHLDEGSLAATVRGEPLDPSRHEVRNVVKAATYHRLALREEEGWLVLTVVFDV